MSAKLLYSLSDEDQNLQKPMGCMNGLIQFFDPHHFISNRINSTPRIPSDGNKQEEGAVKNFNKKSMEKHLNDIKEKQVSPTEPSRLSISSTGSTVISSSEYEWTPKPEQSPFAEPDSHERQSHSSPCQPSSPSKMSHYFHKKHTAKETVPTTGASSIKTAPKEVFKHDQKHIDSPRLSNMSKLDSPRLASINESFRSISSYNSAPVVTPRNREVARLSYDGGETKGGRVSGVKLKDLPRLSLDSKPRTRKDSSCESKDDFHLGNLKRDIQGSNETETEIKKPMSYRAPSNIVAKLMGLQALPVHDVASANNNQVEQYGFHKYVQSCDALSRSSSTVNESKVDRVIYSPRSNRKESRVLQSIEAKAEQTASIDQEVHTEPKSHTLTVYGAMEKSLADLNFQKSGKDLRALKHILESMHKQEKKLEFRLENQSSDGESQTNSSSSFHISQKQGPKTASPATNKNRNRCVNEVKSTRKIKPTKLVKGSRKANQVVHDMPVKNPQRLRILQEPVEGNKVSLKKKTAKDLKEVHHTLKKYSGERTPRPVRASKPMTKANMTKSAKTPDYRSPPATSGYEVKQNNHFMGSSEFSIDPACLSQQENANLMHPKSNSSTVSHVNRVVINAEESCMKYETLQQPSDNKNPEVRGDMAFEELKITTLREQPSPVSVLDANFFEDESPSPIKKKYIAFRDFDTNATDTEPKWNYTGLTRSSDGTRPGFSFQGDYQKLDNFKESAPDVQILNSYEQGNLSSTTSHYGDTCLERSYVYEILLASGFLDHPNYTTVEQLFHQSQEAINPNLFFVLEQTKGSSVVSYQRFDSIANRITRTNERQSRRLLFDAVNDILTLKISRTKPLLKNQSELSTNGPQLLHEVLKEVDLLQAINWPHSLDDEEDFLTAIIGKDLMHRSANWTDVSAEIPALALDIERLIFKDLIVELVHSECAEVQAQKHRTHHFSYLS